MVAENRNCAEPNSQGSGEYFKSVSRLLTALGHGPGGLLRLPTPLWGS